MGQEGLGVTSSLARGYKALVLGASGAIGSAFVELLQADPDCASVYAAARRMPASFDLTDPESIELAAASMRPHGPFHLIIDATGALTIDAVGPEKSLASLHSESLHAQLQVNTIGPALLLKHFAPLLASGPSTYAKLSARVGSITDNKKGGWYSYRASKAAMNMVLQTGALELQRRNPALRVVALQPGTVRSHLSAPFAANSPHLIEPEESVAGMMAAIKALQPISGAHFIDYKGEPIEW